MDRQGQRGWTSSDVKHDNWFDSYYPDEPDGFVPKRSVYRRESSDLVHWSKSSRVLAPDTEDDLQNSFYWLRHFRISDIYLGLLNVFQQVDNSYRF